MLAAQVPQGPSASHLAQNITPEEQVKGMQLATTGRMVRYQLLGRTPKANYWAAYKFAALLRRMMTAPDHRFLFHAAEDMRRFIIGAKPVQGQTRERAHAAALWLARAQDATGNGGVSLGYFPCTEPVGWWPAYPETTGYIITTFINYARQYKADAFRERALKMARWEVQIQLPSGGVQGGMFNGREGTPCVFNTGMVLDGWCSAYEETHEAVFRDAGRRAADYLLGDLSSEGYFKTNGQFVSDATIKTYNCLCAWSLHRYGDQTGQERYKIAAIRIADAALRQQHSNGWFANNCLDRPDAPLLHTIGYTLQGILEMGILTGRSDYIGAVQRSLDPLLARLSAKGFLHGSYYSDWTPAVFSSCLTGSAQLAVVCFRLYDTTGIRSYRTAGKKIVNYLKSLQDTKSSDPGINGALAGSFPVIGSYMPGGYPNWATKYFLDCLMFQDRLKDN